MPEIINLIKRISEQNIYIDLELDELVIKFDGETVSESLLSDIKLNKHLLVDYLKKARNISDAGNIQQIDHNEFYPVSAAQYRLWVQCKIDINNYAYNVTDLVRVFESFDIDLLIDAINLVVGRHESLRTVFIENEFGEVYQKVIPKSEFNFNPLILDYTESNNVENEISAFVKEDSKTTFDLNVGPLFQIVVFLLPNNSNLIYYKLHHIISDAWSLNVLLNDIQKHYKYLEQENTVARITPLKIQYKDYVHWQNQLVENNYLVVHRNYWLEKLSGELEPLVFPSFQKRKRVRTNKGKRLGVFFTKELTEKLKKFCIERSGTLYAGVVTALKLLLSKYTGQNDVIIGIPTSGRNHPELEDQIGYFINTLPLRNYIRDDLTFNELFEDIKFSLSELYRFQNYPFDLILQDLNVTSQVNKNPIFDLLVGFQNVVKSHDIYGTEYTEEIIDLGEVVCKYDLLLNFHEVSDTIYFYFEYNEEIYEELIIRNFINHFKQLVENAIDDPRAKVADIAFLGHLEKNNIIKKVITPKYSLPTENTIISLFYKQVESNPDDLALKYHDTELTYGELNILTNKFAHFLLDNQGIRYSDYLGIMVKRSEWLIISIISILKLGKGYVPIDIENSLERKLHIKEDCSLTTIIDEDQILKFVETQHCFSKENIVLDVKPNSPAYIIYTSGSTGKAKGVQINHYNVTSLIKSLSEVFSIGKKDVWTMFHSECFDFSVWEIFGSLLNGSCLIIVPTDIKYDSYEFVKLIEEAGVTILNQTPAALYQFLDEIKSFSELNLKLRYILLGGEKLEPGKLTWFRQSFPEIKMVNLYGVTEATVFATFNLITKENFNLSSGDIGKPIPFWHTIILDKNRTIVPSGIIGEIYIGGPGVANGYHNREDLTKERFVKLNEFSAFSKIWYRTGDLARYNEDYSIEYFGRNDNQVKIRGYRLELEEIENALKAISGIDEAIVKVVINSYGEKELVGYYSLDKYFKVQNDNNIHMSLRKHLSKLLPHYMIPSYLLEVDVFKLNISGKLDRKNLPDPKENLKERIDLDSAATSLQNQLIDLWKEVLDLETIGIFDDFFEIGGQSLKAIKVVSRIKKLIDLSISIQDFYEHSTIYSLSLVIENSIGNSNNDIEPDVEPIKDVNVYDVLPSQTKQFLLYKLKKRSPHNVYYKERIELLDISIFAKTVNTLVRKHELLRTRFNIRHNKVVQVIDEFQKDNNYFSFLDIRGAFNKEDLITEIQENCKNYKFDLENEPSFLCQIVHFNENQYYMFFTMDHIIRDEQTLNILRNDFMEIYNCFLKGDEICSTESVFQFKDYVKYHNSQISKDKIGRHLDYFETLLTPSPPRLDIKSKKVKLCRKSINRSHRQEIDQELAMISEFPEELKNIDIYSYLYTTKQYNGGTFTIHLEREIFEQCLVYSKKKGRTVYHLFVAAITCLLKKITLQEDFVLNSPISNRSDDSFNNVLGWMTGVVLLRMKVEPQMSFEELVDQSYEKFLAAYDHRFVPNEFVMNHLDIPCDQLASISLNFLDQSNQKLNENLADYQIRKNVRFDLSFIIKLYSDGIEIVCSHKDEVLDMSEIPMICDELVDIIKHGIKQ
ncbi:amino acid adenylation domain-containing protein [Sphingobacterium kitahiroshimense]|uniref:Amino acid adenylation domain-containing protein n=1 Tax=Sphingobacterium kitahiroshimense TaxID=470446 RepID=A0ABV0BYV5_9SPHI